MDHPAEFFWYRDTKKSLLCMHSFPHHFLDRHNLLKSPKSITPLILNNKRSSKTFTENSRLMENRFLTTLFSKNLMRTLTIGDNSNITKLETEMFS